MNTKTNNKDFSKSSSLKNQESNEVFNGNANASTTAFMMANCKDSTTTNRKERCKEKINNSRKQTQLTCPLPFSKDTTPHSEVSVDFAAEQWFRILLVHLNGKNSKLTDAVEPMPRAFCV